MYLRPVLDRLKFSVAAALVILCNIAWVKAAPRVELSRVGGEFSVAQAASGRWTVIGMGVENHTDKEQPVLGLVAVDGLPGATFGRSLVSPPMSRLHFWTPVHTAETDDGKSAQAALFGTLIGTDSATEHALSRQQGIVMIDRRRFRSQIICNSDDYITGDWVEMVQEMTGDKKTYYIRNGAMPVLPLGWQSTDLFVIAHEQPEVNDAQAAAMANWVAQGGKICFVISRNDPAILERCLGPELAVRVVDHIRISDVAFDGQSGPAVSLDSPVTMARVIAPVSAKVIQSIGGWPAAFSLPYGSGAVMVITVDARAYMVQDPATREQLSRTVGDEMGLVSLAWTVGRTSNGGTQARPGQTAGHAASNAVAWDQYVGQTVGYRVITRSVVATLLIAAPVALILIGLLVHKRGRGEWMGWMTVVLAVTTAGILVGLGSARRQQTPSTLAAAGVISAQPGQSTLRFSGQLALYSPEHQWNQLDCGSDAGLFWPNSLASRSTRPARMIWSGLDQWAWRDIDLLPGAVSTASFDAVLPVDQPVSAKVTFDNQGARGTIIGWPAGSLLDPLVACEQTSLLPSFDKDGSFTVGKASALVEGQYISTTLAGDDQTRRQDLYRQLFAQTRFPRTPRLMAWTRSTIRPVKLDPSVNQTGMSLLSIPIEFERPANGTEVLIPPAFMTYEVPVSRQTARKTGPRPQRRRTLSTAFSATTWSFIPINQAGTVEIDFSIPQSLLPISVTRVRVDLDISAPGRTVKVTCGPIDAADGAESSAVTFDSPLGGVRSLDLDLTGKISPGKRLAVWVTVSEPAGDESSTMKAWQIRGIRPWVTGRIDASR